MKKSSFAILGAGFGLYGYLPALIACGQDIFLPERYKVRFNARTELQSYAQGINWCNNEEHMLSITSAALLALSPQLQSHWLDHCLAKKNIRTLFLEKPLAVTPDLAFRQLERLRQANIEFAIGYLFRYTPWANLILTQAHLYKKISIHWQFMAHHFQHNLKTWKRFHAEGGGVIRFYGIHLIALLAEKGYHDVAYSKISVSPQGEYQAWHACFTGPGLPDCDIHIDSAASNPQFHIFDDRNNKIIELTDPFATPPLSTLDRRVPLLIQFCSSFLHQPAARSDWYEKVLELWSQAESRLSAPMELLNPL